MFQLTVNGACGLRGRHVQPRVALLNAREHANAIILQPRMAVELAKDLRNRKSTASWSLA